MNSTQTTSSTNASLTPETLMERDGKSQGVYCVRACIGYVSGHVRGTRGKMAVFTHPRTHRTWKIYQCGNCQAFWKEEVK
jgi:hypothetical protein